MFPEMSNTFRNIWSRYGVPLWTYSMRRRGLGQGTKVLVYLAAVVSLYLTIVRVRDANPCYFDSVDILRNFTSHPVPEIASRKTPYIIENKGICFNSRRLKILIVVHSAVNHTDRRASFRETWANYYLFPKDTMRLVFLLGKPDDSDKHRQKRIEEENTQNRDIVQGDFLDTYHNLTMKAVLGLRWITENCRSARYIVKVDDDVFVNVFLLLNLIENEFKHKRRHILCPKTPARTDLIPRTFSKWKVSREELHNLVCYPFTYCKGYTNIITSDLIPELFTKAKETPFFWLDDVYVYGVLAAKLDRVTHVNIEELTDSDFYSEECFSNNGAPCKLIAARAPDSSSMKNFWRKSIFQDIVLAQEYLKVCASLQ